jgi:hypothetical protein
MVTWLRKKIVGKLGWVIKIVKQRLNEKAGGYVSGYLVGSVTLFYLK